MMSLAQSDKDIIPGSGKVSVSDSEQKSLPEPPLQVLACIPVLGYSTWPSGTNVNEKLR